jgi:hypothetical protein
VAEDLGGHTIVSGANNLARSHNLDSSLVISSDNPLLGPLANNGGPTLTHALQSGSPAVGQGSNPLNLTSDQRTTGFSRNIGGQADIGAYEIQSPVSQNFSGDYNGDNSVGAGDYVLWRKTLGTPVPQFSAADGNGNSTIDPGDYEVWRGHFGALPAAGKSGDLLVATSAAPGIGDDQTVSMIGAALLATLASPTSRNVSFADSSNANLSCTSRAQSSISLERRDEALLAITSSPHSSKLQRFAASRRVHPGGKDATQPGGLTRAITQSLPQILPSAAASTSKA